MSLAGGPSFSRIAFYVAILELAVVSAKNVVEGITTVFDECMVLMTNRLGPLVRESISRWRGGEMKIKGMCRNIVCIMST